MKSYRGIGGNLQFRFIVMDPQTHIIPFKDIN